MTKRDASFRSAVAPFLAMDMLRAANAAEAAGSDIIHMEVGQPSGPPPRRVLEAAGDALDGRTIGYTEALGRPDLRRRIQRYYRDAHGLDIAEERIVVTTGSSGGFILAFLAAFDVGDRVALSRPGYPAYRNILTALGLAPVEFSLSAAERFLPSADQIREVLQTGKVDGLLVASPANPTGSMLDDAELGAIATACADGNAWFISDEIYHRLTYGKAAACALAWNDDAIVINSFSKYYCMTGWRIGWMVVPERLVRAIERLAQNLFISPPALSQIAALAAFDADDELEARRRVYADNRELLMTELPGLGLGEFAPVDGAFYIYADVSRFTNDSHEFATRMLAEAGIAVTPGADFDARDGHKFLRFSFAGATADMHEGLKRLRTWLA